MLSEWIHVVPNEFGVEGPILVGAYGMGLNAWDFSYIFQNRDNGVYSPRFEHDVGPHRPQHPRRVPRRVPDGPPRGRGGVAADVSRST